MITWLVMLFQKISVANYIAIMMAVVWVIYIALFLVIKPNRGKRKIANAVLVGAAVTFVCDIVWFFKFFDNFQYLNPGISGIAWLCLLPAAMLLTVMFLSYINTSRYQYDEKKRLKEEEKQRKKESRRAKYEPHQEEKDVEKQENSPSV